MTNIALLGEQYCFEERPRVLSSFRFFARANNILLVLVDLPMWMADLQFFTILGRFIDLPYLCRYK